MHRVALIALVLAGAAHADDSDAPIRYRHEGTLVIMHHGGHLSAPQGDTPLDNLRTFDCISAAGCAVLLNAFATTGNAFGQGICPQIDGQDGTPKCRTVVTGQLIAREVAKVGQGTHTVQTLLRNGNGDEVPIDGWETDYTIYERKVKGAD
jgi:hypothetical protein